jgi:hypothetical protein
VQVLFTFRKQCVRIQSEQYVIIFGRKSIEIKIGLPGRLRQEFSSPKMIVTSHKTTHFDNPVTAILVEGLWQSNVYHFKKCNFCVKVVDIKFRYYNYLHVPLSEFIDAPCAGNTNHL